VGRLTLLGVLAALVVAPPASAKWCVRITASPARPVVGAPVTIRVQTFQPDSRGDGKFEPGERLVLLSPAPILLAYSPQGVMQNPTLRQRRDDGSIWEATVTLRRTGVWRLRTADEGPVLPGCRGRIQLRVAARR
jgi:hypothetical protein